MLTFLPQGLINNTTRSEYGLKILRGSGCLFKKRSLSPKWSLSGRKNYLSEDFLSTKELTVSRNIANVSSILILLIMH